MSASRLVLGAGWIAVLVVQASLGETPGDRDLPSARLESFSPYPIATQGGGPQGPSESAIGAGHGEEAKNAAPARLTVEDLGDPQAIEFEGMEVISAQELRRALSTDMAYQVAARPSAPLEDFLDVLEERLTEGYLHSGFPDVRMTVAKRGEKIVAKIAEGARYKQGAIRVVGSEHVDEKALEDWMMSVHNAPEYAIRYGSRFFDPPSLEKEAPWRPGEIADSSTTGKEHLTKSVQLALIELGLPYTGFSIEFAQSSEETSLDLLIEVTDDRPPCPVGVIEVYGLERNTREELLSFLELAEGIPLDGALIERINERLSNSCRFWRYRVTSQFLPRETPLRYVNQQNEGRICITVQEYELAPPLNEALSFEDELLQKAAEWINDLGSHQLTNDIVCSVEWTGIDSPSPMAERFVCAVAADGRFAAELKYAIANEWKFDHGLIVAPDELHLLSRGANRRFSLQQGNSINFTMQINPSYEEGKYSHHMTFGGQLVGNYEQGPARALKIIARAEPVAMVHLAHRLESVSRIADGLLTISNQEHGITVVFDADSGEFLSLTAEGDIEGRKFAIVVERKANGFDEVANTIRERASELSNSFDETADFESTIRFLLAELRSQPYLRRRAELSSNCEAALLLTSSPAFARWCSEEWRQLNIDPLTLEEIGSSDFRIPAGTPGEVVSEEERFRQAIARATPFVADSLFERGSWPWTFAREIAFLIDTGPHFDPSNVATVQSLAGAADELLRLAETNRLGPVGCFVLACLVSKTPEFALRVSRKGLTDLSDEAFLRDVRLLTDGDSGLATLSRASVEQLWGLPAEEQAEFLAALASEAREAARRLLEIRHEDPEIEPGEAIATVLLSTWNDSLRERVKLEFERVIATAKREQSAGAIPEAASEATVK